MDIARRHAGTLALVALVAAGLVVVDLVSTGRIVDATRTELSAADLLATSDELVDALQAYETDPAARTGIVDLLVKLEAREELSPAMRGVVREIRAVVSRCPVGANRPVECLQALPRAISAADQLEVLVAEEIRRGRGDLQAHADRVWIITRLSVGTTLVTLLAIVFLLGSGFLGRRRQRAELASSQRLVRFLTERGADVVARQDAEGRVRWVSPSIERLLGFRPEQLVGHRASEFVFPDDRPKLRAMTDPRVGSQPMNATRFRVIRKDGTTAWLEGTTTPLFDASGRLSELLLAARDVTREVEAEETVRRGEDRLRSALEASLDAFYLLDAKRGPDGTVVDFTFVDANAVAVGGSGRSREALLGASLLEVLPVVRENGQFDEFVALLADGKPFVRERQYEVPGLGMRTLQQQVVRVGDGIAVSARDVTTRILTEERLRRVQRLEALGRLGAGVAHDFNNNLATIRNLTQLALETPGVPAAAKDDLVTILGVADRSAALTRHLLSFARQQALTLAAVDAREVVRAAVDLLQRETGPRIQVVAVLPDDAAPVRADAPLLEQVLLNLGLNARDAMPDGGSLRFEVTTTRLDADLSHTHGIVPAGPWVVVRVTDTGSGMDEHVRAHLLEPFFTTKAAGRGTGLGLPMAWGIVTQGGGHLTVDTAPGQGTTITLYLQPATALVAPAPTVPSRMQAEALPLSGRVLLVVDDEPTVRRTLVRVLRSRGAETVEAADGAAGLAELERSSRPFDAVLSDVTMPVLDGLGLGRAIATRWPGLPLVLMSGHGDAMAGAQGLPVDAVFIAKPYEADDLVATILDVVSRPKPTHPRPGVEAATVGVST